jgi:hypothetical protein
MVRAGIAAIAVGAILVACTNAAPSRDAAIAPTSDGAIAQTAGASTAGARSAIAPFDGAKAWEHLRRQVALGPRPAGSPAIAETRRYITDQLKAIGLTAREQAFTGDTPVGKVPMVNLIATIPGRRSERIVIGTHYDTKRFREFRFLGASDAASSTAVTLELARVLKAQQPEFTIELLFLDGEEAVIEWQGNDHTYGSRYYVQAAQQANTIASLKAFILLDMVGDRNLNIRRDANSTPWLVDLVWASAGRLGYRSSFPEELTTIEDDHVPFVRAGVASVDIIDLDYPAWHTAQDDLDHVSARSLQIVGDVMVDALPRIQQQLAAGSR